MCIDAIGAFEVFSAAFLLSGVFLAGAVISREVSETDNHGAAMCIVLAFGTAGCSAVGVIILGLARWLS